MWRKKNSLKLIQIPRRTAQKSLKNLGIKLSYDPAILLPDVYPKEVRIEKDTCTTIFIAALFTIAMAWKQPKCPSTDEWIRKLCYVYTVEYYPAIKRNAFESVLVRWINLEPIIQSKVTQKEKDKYCTLTYIWNLEDGANFPMYRIEKETDGKNRL